jgi:hypothetical protein
LNPSFLKAHYSDRTSVPPGSQPTKRQRQINNAQVWSLSILPIIFIVCVAALELWNKVDIRICPKIIKCKDPCVVEADPDIAGIGVSWHHLTFDLVSHKCVGAHRNLYPNCL